LASIGHHTGVAMMFGLKFSGFIAWWMWRSIYLMKLPRLAKKLRDESYKLRDILLAESNFFQEIRLSMGILDRDIRVKGTAAPSKSLSLSVDGTGEQLVGYRQFVHETRYVAESDMEKIWSLCRTLNRPPTATDARLLTAGGDDGAA